MVQRTHRTSSRAKTFEIRTVGEERVYPKSLLVRIDRLEMEARAKARAVLKKPHQVDHPCALEATRKTSTWVIHHTKTYNEHWHEEGRPSPWEPFPEHEYLVHVFDLMAMERIIFFEKSRDKMMSWACVAYLTRQAMITPCCG